MSKLVGEHVVKFIVLDQDSAVFIIAVEKNNNFGIYTQKVI